MRQSPKHAHEFQCDGGQKGRRPADGAVAQGENCGWYNYPMLDDKMTGNYTIVCGHCGHRHYRTIVDGVVTSDRHSATYGEQQVIHVMPSATSQEKRKRGLIAQFREMVAAGRAS